MAKMTKREMFTAIRERVADNEEMVTFIDHEIEMLDRKNSTPRKPTKTQVENDAFKAEILVALGEAGRPINITDLVTACEPLKGLTNQRITHMLTDLRKEGKVLRTYIKKVAHFTLGCEFADM